MLKLLLIFKSNLHPDKFTKQVTKIKKSIFTRYLHFNNTGDQTCTMTRNSI